jgi:hypothetical protein
VIGQYYSSINDASDAENLNATAYNPPPNPVTDTTESVHVPVPVQEDPPQLIFTNYTPENFRPREEGDKLPRPIAHPR